LNLLKGFTKVVDLSHPISPTMQVFGQSWHKPVAFDELGSIEAVGRRTTHIHIGTHSGTHIDAPSHFIVEGDSIDILNLEIFNGFATKVSLEMVEPKKAVTIEMLKRAIGEQSLSERIVLSYDWSCRYGNKSFYTDSPYLVEDSAKWLIDMGVILLGYDTAMPDRPEDGFGSVCDSPMHKLFLEAGIPLLEYMNNLEMLPRDFYLTANPLRLEGLDGSPVRCIGLYN
jgi:kynurenine formamidase